ncbi:MAG TPA: ATP-binding cassette domain-containing protein [Burkholderiaceae bacterium]|nr:ATP-binding cassette domain-containing protein [Burkholderiaceae bacterium]
MTAALVAQGVTKRFGAVTAADSLDIRIEPDSIVGLIGSNGAGKTTFLNMVTGYLRPDSGSIRLGEHTLDRLAPREITRLGVARSFQIPQLFGSLSVADNLATAVGIARATRADALAAGAAARAVDELIEHFGLGPYRHRPAALLPEGVRKLLDVAMALVVRPRILLLDEPTSGVSAQEKFAIMDLVMSAVAGAQVTVLFVEHDMDIVRRYAQRVLAFYDGRIIGDGDPGAVLDTPDVRRYVIGEAAHA